MRFRVIGRARERPASGGPVAVVGAGPAGARAAELLGAGGREVLLFDPRAPWEKPCGGGIPAHAFVHFPELAELGRHGRWIRRGRLVAPGGRSVVVETRASILLVDRRILASYQLDRATTAGARLIARRIQELEGRHHGFRLRDDAGESYDVAIVIGADGATSRVRRQLSPALQPMQTPTRGRFVPIGPDRDPELLVRFLPGFPGYVWEFPRGATASVGVCHLERGAARSRLERALQDHVDRSGGSLDHPTYGHPIPLLRQEDFRDPDRFGGADWALCGDAAALLDPITGEGIHHALRSGQLAADTLLETGSLAGYTARLHRHVLRELSPASRFATRFYRAGFTLDLVEACCRSRRVRALLANVMVGHVGYRALPGRTAAAVAFDGIAAWRLLRLFV